MKAALSRLLATIRPFAKPDSSRRAYDGPAAGAAGFHRHAEPACRPVRGPVARRARALVANNPLAASAVEAWVSALVGTGIKSQFAHPDESVRAALNIGFERWTDEAGPRRHSGTGAHHRLPGGGLGPEAAGPAGDAGRLPGADLHPDVPHLRRAPARPGDDEGWRAHLHPAQEP